MRCGQVRWANLLDCLADDDQAIARNQFIGWELEHGVDEKEQVGSKKLCLIARVRSTPTLYNVKCGLVCA